MSILIQAVISGVLLGGVYILASIGLSLVFGAAKLVNFAHGEFLMLGMFSAFWTANLLKINPIVNTVFVTLLFFVFGLVVYLGLIRPSLNGTELTQVFVTLGLSIVLQNLALMLWGPDYRTIPTSFSGQALNITPVISISVSRLLDFVISLLILFILSIFLRKTFIGKAIQAVSQDRSAAMLMGVNISKVYMIAFGIGVACTGMAGSILVTQYNAFPTVGTYFILITFLVVVMGGIGSIKGTIVGGILVGLIESLSGLVVPELKEAFYFVFFILILLFRPYGIFGIKGSEEEAAR